MNIEDPASTERPRLVGNEEAAIKAERENALWWHAWGAHYVEKGWALCMICGRSSRDGFDRGTHG